MELTFKDASIGLSESSYMDDMFYFLLAAVVVVSLFRSMRVSSIIGYLIAGIIIGPHVLGFIRDIDGTRYIAQFGVVFLLFSIGLKLPLRHLHVLRRYVFGLGFAQVTITGVICSGIAYFYGLNTAASILIGSCIALSSTAVGIQILVEKEELATRFGRVSFAILLFQDLAVIVLLVLVTALTQQHIPVLQILGFASLKAGIVLAIIITLGRVILRPVYRLIASLGNPELFVAMTLLVVLTTSMLTDAADLSMELGAFLAGLLISETEYRHQVEADIRPFHGLLLGLFFMTVGMSIDLPILFQHNLTILAIISAMIVVKGVIIFILSRLFALPGHIALRTGLLLAAGGEFAFVVFVPAMEMHLIPIEIGQILMAVIALSMGLTPLLNMAGRYFATFFMEIEARAALHSTSEEIEDIRNHVLIAGFGRVGQLVARLLTERMIPYVALDIDMERVQQGRSKGLPVFYGDARQSDVMRALGIKHARMAVICLNDTKNALRTANMVDRYFPHVKICVRMRDDTYEEKFAKIGATVVMPENLEPSLQLAAVVLKTMGASEDETSRIIDNYRHKFSSRSKSVAEKANI